MSCGNIGHHAFESNLREHVARRKCHQLEIRWIPCRKNDPPVIRIIFYLVNNIQQLIKSLTSIVSMHVRIPVEEMWKALKLKSCKKNKKTNFKGINHQKNPRTQHRSVATGTHIQVPSRLPPFLLDQYYNFQKRKRKGKENKIIA